MFRWQRRTNKTFGRTKWASGAGGECGTLARGSDPQVVRHREDDRVSERAGIEGDALVVAKASSSDRSKGRMGRPNGGTLPGTRPVRVKSSSDVANRRRLKPRRLRMAAESILRSAGRTNRRYRRPPLRGGPFRRCASPLREPGPTLRRSKSASGGPRGRRPAGTEENRGSRQAPRATACPPLYYPPIQNASSTGY